MTHSTTTTKHPVLVLGGTGTVGSRIASQLHLLSHPVLIASRAGDAASDINPATNTPNHPTLSTVNFNWQDRSTWDNPFRTATCKFSASPYSASSAEVERGSIRSVYLIAPPGVLDAANLMMEFVDFARIEKGVRRFVLQSASCIEGGGPSVGKVHGHLRELGARGEIEWAVLRPSWFQENFAVQQNHVQSIKNEGKVYSATGDGKIPWVSADDIAAVAVQTLTMADAPNTEYLVLGPELLSYDDIAKTLSEILGKKIVHVDLTSSDLEKRHQAFGMPEDYSRMMSALDTGIKYGMENRTNDVVLSVTGVAPKQFKDFAESVKSVWIPAHV